MGTKPKGKCANKIHKVLNFQVELLQQKLNPKVLSTVKPRNLLILGPSKIVPQIANVIVFSKWDRMVYTTVLTAEKLDPQIAGVQIAGAQIPGA